VAVAARTCIVTVTDLRDIRRSVQVTADSVFEAAAHALAALGAGRLDRWHRAGNSPGDSGEVTGDHAHGDGAAVGAVGERVRGQSGRANPEGSVEASTHDNLIIACTRKLFRSYEPAAGPMPIADPTRRSRHSLRRCRAFATLPSFSPAPARPPSQRRSPQTPSRCCCCGQPETARSRNRW
jgi:hypothetical protein